MSGHEKETNLSNWNEYHIQIYNYLVFFNPQYGYEHLYYSYFVKI